MKRMCFLSLALAAALTVGCRGDNRSATTANPQTGSPVGTSGAADISRSDRDFVKDAAITSMAEPAICELKSCPASWNEPPITWAITTPTLPLMR